MIVGEISMKSHEIPWKSHCPIAKLSLWRHDFVSSAEEPKTISPSRTCGLEAAAQCGCGSHDPWANQLKRPSYRDMSSYTKLYISRYTLAYYAHLCTSRHYVHHLRSGAVYAVHNLHIRRRFTNMTYHSEWSLEDGQKIIVLPGASLLSFRARGTLLQPVVWPGIILRHTHLLPNDAKVSDCCFIDRK